MSASRIQPIEKATERSWADWLAYLDRVGAENLDHHAIAIHLLTELDGIVDNLGWYAQAIAVAYEQHTGRRVPGQQPDGTFRMSVSRSTTHQMAALMSKWVTFAATDPDVQQPNSAEPRISGTDHRITWRTKGHHGSNTTRRAQHDLVDDRRAQHDLVDDRRAEHDPVDDRLAGRAGRP